MTKPEPRQQPQNSQPDFECKVAIVTGAASGIGRATALLSQRAARRSLAKILIQQ